MREGLRRRWRKRRPRRRRERVPAAHGSAANRGCVWGCGGAEGSAGGGRGGDAARSRQRVAAAREYLGLGLVNGRRSTNFGSLFTRFCPKEM